MGGAPRSQSFIPSEAILAAGFLVANLLFWVAPGTAFFDSGELAATAVELGVPHPTGFPSLNLAGHALTMVPLGPATVRVHVLGTILTVGAALVGMLALFGSGSRGVVGGFIGWAAALFIAVGAPSLMRHALAAEVYPLVLLHAAAILLAAAIESAQRRLLVAFGLAACAGGIHAESVLLSGVFLVVTLVVAARSRGLRAVAPVVIHGLALVAVGALVIAYLPLAAARPAAFSWGDVTSAGALWDHLSAASIRRAFAGDIGTAGAGTAVARLGAGIVRDLGFLLPVAAVGAVVAWRTDRHAALAVIGLVAVDAAYSVFINPMGLVDQQCGLVVALGLGLLAARGCLSVAETLRNHNRAVALAAVIALAIVGKTRSDGARAAEHPDSVRKIAHDAGTWLAAEAPGKLVVVSADHTASACIHQQIAEGQRPDVLCMPGVFARDPTMLRVLARTGREGFDRAILPTRNATNVREMAGAMAHWLRPPLRHGSVGWELGNAAEDAQVLAHFVPGFPFGNVMRRMNDERFELQAAQARQSARRFCGKQRSFCPLGSESARYVARWASVTAARLMRGKRKGAGSFLAVAVEMAPNDGHVLNNLAVHELSRGNVAAARAALDRAIENNAHYAPVHRTATRAALAAGDADAAVEHARGFLDKRAYSPASKAWLRNLARSAPAGTRDRLLRLLDTDG